MSPTPSPAYFTFAAGRPRGRENPKKGKGGEAGAKQLRRPILAPELMAEKGKEI